MRSHWKLRGSALSILTFGVFLLALPGLVVGAGQPPPGPQPVDPAAPSAQRGEFVVLNFDNADIEVVIRAVSKILRFNYVLAPDVKGKVTVQTSTRIPQEEVFNVLLAILEVHGFTAVKADTLYKIIKLEGARERSVPTVVGTAPDPGHVGDEIITQIVPICFASVPDLTKLLRPLISARGSLIPYRETNLVIITDSASNIRRLLDIIRLMDVEVALQALRVIPLKYADAQELARILNQLFAPGQFRQAVPPPAVLTPAPPPVAGAPPTVPRPPAEAPGPKRPPFVAAYRDTNALIVRAQKSELETIRQLITQLDVDIYAGGRVFIYFPEHVKAKDLAATLNAIYGRAEGASAARRPTPPAAPPPPPPLPPPPRHRGSPAAPGASELDLPRGEVRFIPDESTNAVIVVISPHDGTEETGQKAGQDPVAGTTSPLRGSPRPLNQGFVLIDATPPEAQVFLDGRLLGAARQLVARAVPLLPGRHAVEIISPGFRPYRAQFVVGPSFPTRLRVVLQPE